MDIGPEAPAIKHKHPGEEIIYVLEGSLEYQVEGEPPTTHRGDTVAGQEVRAAFMTLRQMTVFRERRSS